MKSYKKILAIAIIATLAFTVVPSLVTADPDVVPLIAGQHYTAGEVRVTNDAVNIYVEYETSGGWYITGTHLYVGKTNPDTLTTAPGQFPYSEPDEETETYHKYIIPLADIDGYHLKLTKKGKSTGKLEANGNPGVGVDDKVYIAAHAGVCKKMFVSGGLEEVEASLPAQVTVSATHSYDVSYDGAYFIIEIKGGTSLDGTYDGWCIDTDHNMNDESDYLANVYSSYDLPAGNLGIEYPENLDLINYILNQDYVGKSSGCDGDYTYGDVQLAMWELIENDVPYWYFDDHGIEYDPCRITEIVNDATDNGDEFIPGCDELLAVILEPTEITEDVGQLAIIGVPIPCEYEEGCETAWGQGTDFTQPNWAMYFDYTIQ